MRRSSILKMIPSIFGKDRLEELGAQLLARTEKLKAD
jgi:hypothetical protein